MLFTFYATFDADSLASYIPSGISILLPASSWARYGLKPPNIPPQITETAADSGGFIASRIWGDYRYSLAQYVDWLMRWRPRPPTWAAMMDYCCEPELAVVTKERQYRTTANAWQTWCQHRDVPFCWTPTIQGLEPADYQRHALELKDLIEEMRDYYGKRGQSEIFRVGIGTLCRRANSMQIRNIVNAIRAVLPDVAFHLWGIKLAAIRVLNSAEMGIKSTDSAAWHDRLYNYRAIREEAATAGMSQRKFCITVKLPQYAAKIAQAVALHPVLLPNRERDATLPNERENTIAQIRAAIHTARWTLRLRTRRAREYVYAVRRTGARLEERYLGPLDCPTEVVARAGSLPPHSR